MTTQYNTNCCDRCGRGLLYKEWIENLGMKICGICDYEIKNNPPRLTSDTEEL